MSSIPPLHSSGSSSTSASTPFTRALSVSSCLLAAFFAVSLLTRVRHRTTNNLAKSINNSVSIAKSFSSIPSPAAVSAAAPPPSIPSPAAVADSVADSVPAPLQQPEPQPQPLTQLPHSSTNPLLHSFSHPIQSKPFEIPFRRQYLSNHANLNLSTFRVVSYNILASSPRYALSEQFNYCPREFREWEYRWPRIQSEIIQFAGNSLQAAHSYHHQCNNLGGIVCIQESTPTIFRNSLQPFFASLNFHCHESALADPLDADGFERQTDAVFVNQNLFEVVKIVSAPFKQLSQKYFDALTADGEKLTGREEEKEEESQTESVDELVHDHTVSEPNSPLSPIDFLSLTLSESDERMKEKMSWFQDSCTILHLKFKPKSNKPNNNSNEQIPIGFASGSDLIVMTTHLHYHPANPDVKTFQAFLALRFMTEFVRDQLFPSMHVDAIQWDSVPLVFAGDFNSTPCKLFTDVYDPILPKSGLTSGVYELITTGRLNNRHPHHPAVFQPKVEYIKGPRDRGVVMEKVIENNPSHPAPLSRSDSNSSLNSSISSIMSDEPDSIIPSFSLPFRLSSTYSSVFGHEPAFTTKTATFQGCIDYIFFNPGAIRVRSALELPFDEIDRMNSSQLAARSLMEAEATYYPGYPYLSRESSKIHSVAGKGTIGSAGEFHPIPSRDWPSDHLLLAAELEFIKTNEIVEKIQREEKEELESVNSRNDSNHRFQ